MRFSFGIYFMRDFVKLIIYPLIILSPGVLFAQQDSIRSDNNACTQPVITEFKIFNEDLPLDSVLRLKEIELSPQKNSFTISFATTDTAGNVYYMLDGADKNWIGAQRSATINYTL